MGAYQKNTWAARIGTGLNRFEDQDGNIYEFTAAPTEITQQGTPFSADWMNHIEEGIYRCSLNVTGYGVSDASSATLAVTIEACENIPLATGQVYVINFQSSPLANATLNINGTGAKPLYMAFPYAAIQSDDIPTGFIAIIAYDGTNYVIMNRAWAGTERPAGSQFFTTNGTFTVPADVYTINVSACAAGVGRYAGDWIIDTIYEVTPGQSIPITVGSGNTVIGSLATLIAGTRSESVHTTKLGYAAGYNGGYGQGISTNSGFGGAFGFGGGGGAAGEVAGTGPAGYAAIGGGGGGKGGDGGNGALNSGAGGGSSGGAGGNNGAGQNAREGTVIYAGGQSTATTGYAGGGGSIYGAGGGGANKSSGSDYYYGCGGGAGGYGAGAGLGGGGSYEYAAVDGAPAGGMVLIEWGGTYA